MPGFKTAFEPQGNGRHVQQNTITDIAVRFLPWIYMSDEEKLTVSPDGRVKYLTRRPKRPFVPKAVDRLAS